MFSAHFLASSSYQGEYCYLGKAAQSTKIFPNSTILQTSANVQV